MAGGPTPRGADRQGDRPTVKWRNDGAGGGESLDHFPPGPRFGMPSTSRSPVFVCQVLAQWATQSRSVVS